MGIGDTSGMKKPLLPRTNDFVFKKIFGEHIEIFANLLSCIINDLPQDELKSLQYVNTEITGETIADKTSIMDVRAVTTSKHPIDVEMQVRKHKFIENRLQFYSARQYMTQIQTGDDYYLLKKSYTILFADFILLDDKHWFRRAKWCDKSIDWELKNSSEIIVIEMPKIANDNTELANWIRFIKSLDKDELMQLITRNPSINQAYEVLQELSQKQEAWAEFDSREKFWRDQRQFEYEAYDNGFRDAEERMMRENEQRQNEQALYLLSLDLLPEQVAKGSGLPIEKVQQLMRTKAVGK